jgi:hypothetical protein
MGRICSMNWEKGNACEFLSGKSEGKRSLGRSRYRQVNNVEVAFGEMG